MMSLWPTMTWQLAALLLLGGSTALLLLGMPVALSFVAINIVGALLYLGGEPGWRRSCATALCR